MPYWYCVAETRKLHQYRLGFKSRDSAEREFERLMHQPWTIRREIMVLNAICVWIRFHARAKSTIVKESWQNGSRTPM